MKKAKYAIPMILVLVAMFFTGCWMGSVWGTAASPWALLVGVVIGSAAMNGCIYWYYTENP